MTEQDEARLAHIRVDYPNADVDSPEAVRIRDDVIMLLRLLDAANERIARLEGVVEAARRLIEVASGDILDGTASEEEKRLHEALAVLAPTPKTAGLQE